MAVAICGAKKRQGDGTCGQPAGWGTDHLGIGSCKLHGGNTPGQRQKAREEQTRQLARTLGVPVEGLDPKESILREIAWSAGHVAWYRAQVQALDPDALVRGVRRVEVTTYSGFQVGEERTQEAGPDVHLLLRLYNEERDRHTKLCVDAIRLGIEERRVQLQSEQGARLVEGLGWLVALTASKLSLQAQALDVMRAAVGELLRVLASGAPFPRVPAALTAG